MAKMGGTSVIDTVAKMGGGHCGKNGGNWCHRHRDKNGWNSLWEKWVEFTVARIGGTGVIDAVTKMGGTHFGKNGWSSLWQEWVELVS